MKCVLHYIYSAELKQSELNDEECTHLTICLFLSVI